MRSGKSMLGPLLGLFYGGLSLDANIDFIERI